MGMGDGVQRIEVTERETPVFGGVAFGAVGPYERLHGSVFGELDPMHGLNAGIVNLDRAARNTHGNVEYQSDFRILKPLDLDRGNGCLVYDVPNRGNQPILPRLNGAPDGGHSPHAGNGFLMRRGFTMVWSGWQGDVPPGADRLTACFPTIPGISGMVREEFIAEATGLLGDELLAYHAGDAGDDRKVRDQAIVARRHVALPGAPHQGVAAAHQETVAGVPRMAALRRAVQPRHDQLVAAVGHIVHQPAVAACRIARPQDAEFGPVFDQAVRVARRAVEVDDAAIERMVRVDLARRAPGEVLVRPGRAE